MNTTIKHIAIMGSGIELYMTAAILSVALQPFGINIKVLGLPTTDVDALVETTGPEFSALCNILGLVERDVVRQCYGTFRLGSRYLANHHDWFVPFAHLGLKAQQDDFEQGLFQVLKPTNINNLNPWSPASSAAMSGKFAIAGKDRPDLQQALDYGVHLDAAKYRQILATLCQKQGVEWRESTSSSLQVDRDDLGNIGTVVVDGNPIMADFWFDLRAGRSHIAWQDWQSYLPVTFYAQWQALPTQTLSPYSQLQQLQGGWVKTSPLQNSKVVQVFSHQKQCDLAQIEQQLITLGLAPQSTISWKAVRCHVLESPWQGNCLSLGEAAIELGGLVFSKLQCVQTALVQFIDLFPDLPIGEHNRQHYNNVWQCFVQDALDFSAAHYLPQSTSYSNRLNDLPKSLWQRLQLFERLGRLTPMHSDAVSESQWYHLLFGLGLRPQLNSVVLSSMTEKQLQSASQQVKQSIAALVAGMPSHEQYLARFYPPLNQ